MRSMSLTARTAVMAPETGAAFLILLTIDHADLTDPIRVTNDAVTTVSRGQTYLSYPFAIALPGEQEDEVQTTRLRIDNISGEILATLRRLSGKPTLTMDVVVASTPSVVEAGPFQYRLNSIDADALTLEGELQAEPILVEPIPAAKITPIRFPGLFK